MNQNDLILVHESSTQKHIAFDIDDWDCVVEGRCWSLVQDLSSHLRVMYLLQRRLQSGESNGAIHQEAAHTSCRLNIMYKKWGPQILTHSI